MATIMTSSVHFYLGTMLSPTKTRTVRGWLHRRTKKDIIGKETIIHTRYGLVGLERHWLSSLNAKVSWGMVNPKDDGHKVLGTSPCTIPVLQRLRAV
jgi:hypothetical protein